MSLGGPGIYPGIIGERSLTPGSMSMAIPKEETVTTGWECPRCHRAFAPEVQQCMSCPFGSTSRDLFNMVRKDTLVNWDTSEHYKINGISGPDGGPHTWSIRVLAEGKGIIDGSGRTLGNTNMICYCHPCVKRRRQEGEPAVSTHPIEEFTDRMLDL